MSQPHHTYKWTEGATVLATTSDPIKTAVVLMSFGTHTVTLTVSDGADGTSTDQVTINISGSAALSCQADLATANANLAAANATIQQQSTTIQQQAATISDLQSQLAAAQARASSLAQTNTQLTQANAQLTQQNNSVTQQVTTLTQQNTAYSQQVASLTQQNTVLTQQNTALTQQNTALSQQNAALTTGMTSDLGALQQAFRVTFKNPTFAIRGATPLDQLLNLVNGILGMPQGKQKDVYESLK